MEVDVEVRVLDPVWVVEAQRDLRQAPVQRRQQREALGHERADVIDLEPAAGALGIVQDGERADVPALAGSLEREELRIEAGQLAHLSPPTGR